MKEKNLKNLINSKSSNELEKIIQAAADMQLLTTALKDVVTQEISEHLVAANVRDNGELVVICTSSAWASRLRFESKTLISTAQNSGFDASTVRVTVTQN
ncbi:MAG: hypothetical protein CMO98_10125 [Woeseia sp.]|nr:hypothetical protein [Woeseia sp.]|tara:strand:+ start:396 stop:695 length:300 start_codon:yes stop_codon:yes gene_type:complete